MMTRNDRSRWRGTGAHDARNAQDGTSLGLFWAQNDGSIVLQRLRAGAAPLGARRTIVPPAPGSTVVATSSVGLQGGTLTAWTLRRADGSSQVFALALSGDGTPTGAPQLLDSRPVLLSRPSLARRGGHSFAVWAGALGTNPDLVTSTLATLDSASGAPLAVETVDQGLDQAWSALVAEPDRLDLAIFLSNEDRARVLSRATNEGSFFERASFDAFTGASLAADACGRLFALVPSGMITFASNLPTGLQVQQVGLHGTVGARLPMPIEGHNVEAFDLVAVDGGYVVAWLEANELGPPRTLKIAYVSVP